MYFFIALWIFMIMVFGSMTIATGVWLVRDWKTLNNEAWTALTQAFLTGFMATVIMTVLMFL